MKARNTDHGNHFLKVPADSCAASARLKLDLDIGKKWSFITRPMMSTTFWRQTPNLDGVDGATSQIAPGDAQTAVAWRHR